MSSYAGSRAASPTQERRLTDEEMRQMGDRLAVSRRKEVSLPPLHQKKVLTQAAMDQSLERLYTQSMASKKRQLEALEKKAHPDLVKHHTLDHEGMEGMTTRLHTQSQIRKQDTVKKLERKFAGPEASQPRRVLSKEEQEASASRLCHASMEHAREAHIKLFDKYVASHAPKAVSLSPEEIAESAARMTAAGKRA
jgi:hypothetical protein